MTFVRYRLYLKLCIGTVYWKHLYTLVNISFQMNKKLNASKEIEILKPFFENSNNSYHIRQLSRMLNVNHMTVRARLKEFTDIGVLIEKKTELSTNYQVNADDTKFKLLKKYNNLLSLTNSGILEYLDSELNFPTIVLFGSYARAEDISGSDVDLFILTETKPETQMTKFEKILKRPIDLHIFSRKTYKKLILTNPDLVNNICNGIVLRGQFWVFE